MQYVGKVGGYVYNQWNSLNPATLSGAIDIIVIEHLDGTLHCSPWHVRFGKFRIIKPLQKKIDLYVNDEKMDLPMKLGDGGEAFFVFETDSKDLLLSLMTSPVISALSSPEMSPIVSGEDGLLVFEKNSAKSEPDLLDLNQEQDHDHELIPKVTELRIELSVSHSKSSSSEKIEKSEADAGSDSESLSLILRLTFEKVKRITQDLNIPSKIDVNGDVILDMDGYKPNSQKNIDLSDKLVHSIFLKEMNSLLHGNEWLGHDSKDEASPEVKLLQSLIRKDDDGQIRLVYDDAEFEDADAEQSMAPANLTIPSEQAEVGQKAQNDYMQEQTKTYIKTLRLTSEQLLNLNLHYGRNNLVFRLSQGGSQVQSDLYFWKSNIPIVISDIDGTITKSDALGHVLNMFGRDWTHPGVANLFQDITRNGYNILYLTARSVGQADTTRQYLDSINQDGMRLPKGPVILSPDRTMAALRREIILKKPEVFKMACLRDINSLFFSGQSDTGVDDDERTPFYAGFGNRITDAISYRSVKIPSHRIFTINPNGEVHMELLELAGYRSSYLHIGELVDQFFPPLKYISDFSQGWNQDQLYQYIHSKDRDTDLPGMANMARMLSPGSPRLPMSPGLPRSMYSDEANMRPDERFSDLNYWREPLINLSDLTDSDSCGNGRSDPPSPKTVVSLPPLSPRLLSDGPSSGDKSELQKQQQQKKKDQQKQEAQLLQHERPVSASFTSPLKNFMIRGNNSTAAPKSMKAPLQLGPETVAGSGNSEGRDDLDEDDDYTDDDYEDDEDEDEEDDYEDLDEEDEDDDDREEGEEDEADLDDEEEDEVDDDDLDLDDGIPEKPQHPRPLFAEHPTKYDGEDYRIMTASDMLKGLDI